MKISILTPTYNRAHTLNKLYESLKSNAKHNIDFEWLIMDDGSIDDTSNLVKHFIEENYFSIQYFYQENQGKMSALNNLVPKSKGDLIVEIDSDDYFTEDAFNIILENYKYMEKDNSIYAMVFLRKIINGKAIPCKLNNFKTTLFDLYFKYGLVGDTTIVFKSDIRKKYHHKLENNEKFITEARMYNEIEHNYNVLYFNSYISVCEYLEEGYSKNIKKHFLENPVGYYYYFKEMLNINMKGILFKKRLYIIKHYILFYVLTNSKHLLKNIDGIFNKLLIIILFIPGYIKTKLKW